MDVRLPDGTIVTNVPEGTTQTELLRRMGRGAAPSNEWLARTMANMTLADKPWYERAAIQMGAGTDSLVSGVKQLLASDKPDGLGDMVSGETPFKRSQRDVSNMRVLKKALADASDTHTLPDWVPTTGASLQATGESLPLMAVPFGGYAKGAMALPRAFGLAKAAAIPARLGTGAAIADSAIGSAVAGALAPTAEGESRLVNTLTAGLAGAVVPAATAGGKNVLNMVTAGGGRSRAGAQIANELTQGAADPESVLRQTIANIKANSGAHGAIQLSAAAQLRDPQLARLEAGSRARNGANWYDFDQAQAQAVADEVRAATRGAEDVAKRRALRGSNWDTRWAQAEGSANTNTLSNDLAKFRANIDQALMSSEASNPAVKGMLTEIANEIDRVGDGFSLGHLQQIRANLSGKQKEIPQNAYQGAPRESPATRSVLREVDNILNNATNNRWQEVARGYARDTEALNAAKAAGRVRESFYDSATGRVREVSADVNGDVPRITEAGLGRALDAARGPDKSMLLDPSANHRLEAVLEALRAQNIVQGVKRSATAGGGSNTASDQFAAKTASKVGDVVAGVVGGPGGSIAKGSIDKALDWANTHRDRALAEALQDPQQLVSVLERRLAAGQPLSAAEIGVMKILRGMPAASMSN